MKLFVCKEDLMNKFGEVVIHGGEMCAAVWDGLAWEVYRTTEINGRQYVDARDNSHRMTAEMFLDNFE